MSIQKRLFIVSNRLPVCIKEENNEINIQPATGGLVSSITSYLQHSNKQFSEIFWVSVHGCTQVVWNTSQNYLVPSSFNYVAVPVYKERYDNYYNGFSNS